MRVYLSSRQPPYCFTPLTRRRMDRLGWNLIGFCVSASNASCKAGLATKTGLAARPRFGFSTRYLLRMYCILGYSGGPSKWLLRQTSLCLPIRICSVLRPWKVHYSAEVETDREWRQCPGKHFPWVYSSRLVFTSNTCHLLIAIPLHLVPTPDRQWFIGWSHSYNASSMNLHYIRSCKKARHGRCTLNIIFPFL